MHEHDGAACVPCPPCCELECTPPECKPPECKPPECKLLECDPEPIPEASPTRPPMAADADVPCRRQVGLTFIPEHRQEGPEPGPEPECDLAFGPECNLEPEECGDGLEDRDGDFSIGTTTRRK